MPRRRLRISHTASRQVLRHVRARSKYFALDFFAKNRAVPRGRRDLLTVLDSAAWRLHVPRIWKRSINACENSVK